MIRHCAQGHYLERQFADGQMQEIAEHSASPHGYVVKYRDQATNDSYARTTLKRIVRTNPRVKDPYFLDKSRCEFVRGRWLDNERIDKSRPFLRGDLLVPDYGKVGRPGACVGAAVATLGVMATGGLAVPLMLGAAVAGLGGIAERDLTKDFQESRIDPVYIPEGIMSEPASRRRPSRHLIDIQEDAHAEHVDARAWIRSPGIN